MMASRTFDSLSDFMTAESLESGVFRVNDNGLPIDASLEKHVGRPLLVFLHGAKTRKVDLPWFVGAGMTAEREVSRLSISDPSLYISEELTLAWYAGNANQGDISPKLASLIAKCAELIRAERIILIGGSGGGFASLSIGAHIDGSIALVWNPQTHIRKYYKRFVDDYEKVAWKQNGKTLNDLKRLDLTTIYSQPLKNTVIYLQSATDEFHIQNHLQPFKQKLHPENRCYFYTETWGEGHIPPPKNQLATWISFSLAIDLDNQISWQNLETSSRSAGVSQPTKTAMSN